MKRDSYLNLLDWKKSETRKPLIVKGVRQVGKTYILKEFGKNEYAHTAYFNFEDDPGLVDFFIGRLQPEQIIRKLSIYSDVPIHPHDTLIIFDEIQNSPRTLTSLKYFCEDAPGYHVAAAGSLLGLKLGHASPFPVGKVNFLELYPLTFGEFLDALGRPQLREFLKNLNGFEPIDNIFHDELIDQLISKAVAETNAQLVQYKQIKKYYLQEKELEKTTTQKIKRHLADKVSQNLIKELTK
ncbi:MAG: AAA family ATPase [Acidobacteria bacterium]|nr:AAA family ATPase [Acidobacteriota bacterium]